MANSHPDGLNVNAILALILTDRSPGIAKCKWHKYLREPPRPLFEKLLDSFAEASTANPKESVAVAVCIHHLEKRILFFVSGNHDISTKKVDYLRNLWGLLRSLALENTIPRKPTGNIITRKLRTKVLHAIYSFSHRKFFIRFRKWHQALLVFRKRLFKDLHRGKDLKRGIYESMEDILETIDSIIAVLNTVSQVFREYPDGPRDVDPEGDLWQTFVASMDFLEGLLGDIETVACVFEDLDIQIDSQSTFAAFPRPT